MNPMQRMIIAKAAHQAPPMARSELPLNDTRTYAGETGSELAQVTNDNGFAFIFSDSTINRSAYTSLDSAFSIDWPANQLRIFELKAAVTPEGSVTDHVIFSFGGAITATLTPSSFSDSVKLFADSPTAIVGKTPVASISPSAEADAMAIGIAGNGDYCVIANGQVAWTTSSNLPIDTTGDTYNYGVYMPASGASNPALYPQNALLRRQAHTFELSYPDMSSHGITVLADIDGTPLPASLTA